MQFSSTTPNTTVPIIFTDDGATENEEESLILELFPPTPSALLTGPSGEGVFFQNSMSLTIINSNGRCNTFIYALCHGI